MGNYPVQPTEHDYSADVREMCIKRRSLSAQLGTYGPDRSQQLTDAWRKVPRGEAWRDPKEQTDANRLNRDLQQWDASIWTHVIGGERDE